MTSLTLHKIAPEQAGRSQRWVLAPYPLVLQRSMFTPAQWEVSSVAIDFEDPSWNWLDRNFPLSFAGHCRTRTQALRAVQAALACDPLSSRLDVPSFTRVRAGLYRCRDGH